MKKPFHTLTAAQKRVAIAKFKWRKGRYKITCNLHPETITGQISKDGIWGVSNEHRGVWMLTHIPTGRRFSLDGYGRGYQSAYQAKAFAAAIAPLADWSHITNPAIAPKKLRQSFFNIRDRFNSATK